MNELPHSCQSRGIRVAFCYIASNSLIVDAACAMWRVRFSGRDCTKREISWIGSPLSGIGSHVEDCIV